MLPHTSSVPPLTLSAPSGSNDTGASFKDAVSTLEPALALFEIVFVAPARVVALDAPVAMAAVRQSDPLTRRMQHSLLLSFTLPSFVSVLLISVQGAISSDRVRALPEM